MVYQRTDIKEQKLLYHITDLANLESILARGIMPRNELTAFSDVADLDYSEQIDDFSRLDELDLKKIASENYWSDFKEEKQAEFLAFESVQWQTIRWIGVKTEEIAEKVKQILQHSTHKPEVLIQPNWYY